MKAARDIEERDHAALVTNWLARKSRKRSDVSLAALETFLRIYPRFAEELYAVLAVAR